MGSPCHEPHTSADGTIVIEEVLLCEIWEEAVKFPELPEDQYKWKQINEQWEVCYFILLLEGSLRVH